MMLSKCYTQYVSKFRKLSSGHRTRKGPFSFQSQRKVKVKSLSRFRLFATPWTVANQAPPSMGFSRQEYWSGLPLSSPGDLLWSRDRTRVSCIPGRRFNLWAIREPLAHVLVLIVKTSFPSRLWMISLGEDRWPYSSRERGGQNWESWTKKAREGI